MFSTTCFANDVLSTSFCGRLFLGLFGQQLKSSAFSRRLLESAAFELTTFESAAIVSTTIKSTNLLPLTLRSWAVRQRFLFRRR